MKVLGIETSCDETAAAVVEDGRKLLSNVVASSLELHKKYGGVVPEIAARSHIESITPVIDKALKDAFSNSKSQISKSKHIRNTKYQIPNTDDLWSYVDAIAVTQGAGLGGSLLIGVLAARTLAIIKNKPLYAINHVMAHVYANFITSTGPRSLAFEQSSKLREHSLRDATLKAPLLSRSSNSTASSVARSRLASHQSPAAVNRWKLDNQTYTLPGNQPKFPMLALIVSGGHTQLVLFENHFKYKLLGQTHDDAIGEAFDKVAKMLGLPYPGGPSIEKITKKGNAEAFDFPTAKMPHKYDFSFSGLKTAVLREAQKLTGHSHDFPSYKLARQLSALQKADLAASFQQAALGTVVDKTVNAYKEFKPASVVLAGGVAASKPLRTKLTEVLPVEIEYTDPKLCTDNGAMVAALGFFTASYNQKMADPFSLEIAPNLSM